MESRPWRRWAPPGPLPAPWLLGLLLPPWTLQLTGGQSVAHTGPPIMVTLANKSVFFSCNITYRYTPEFKAFTVSYFYVNRQGRTSSEEQTGCQPGTGTENQTVTTKCKVSPKLPSEAATGTYYCSVSWPHSRVRGPGTFILVRDTGYREPPRVPQKVLLSCFIGLLGVLSVLGTALLLWKKRQMKRSGKHPARSGKHPARKGPAPCREQPEQPQGESLYTALQRRETEVYACMQHEASSAPLGRSFLYQENARRFENDDEFNQVYENL